MTAVPGSQLTQSSTSSRGMLRWQDQDGKAREFHLFAGNTVQIGRAEDNDVILNFPGISRYHAILASSDGPFEISDLGSTNGTFVNDQSIVRGRGHILTDGDHIQLHELELLFLEVSPGPLEAELNLSETVLDSEETIVSPHDSPRPRLIVSAGSQEGQQFPLLIDTLLIGRATATEQFDISLQDRAISRPHAQFERHDSTFVVTDLGSVNGTLVNGDCITQATPLRDGDVILLGDTTLLFRLR